MISWAQTTDSLTIAGGACAFNRKPVYIPRVADPVDLSIVIPAWNEAECLEETLDRIGAALRANHSDGLTWEIVVCDNSSTDDTAAVARRAGARVVFEPERGIARARNAGAGVARGDWLLFIDADSYPTPELMTDMRTLLGERRIVGCGAMMTADGGSWWMRGKVSRDNIVLSLLGLAPGVFLLCRHDAFRAIGGFNADLYAFEEIGFVLRLRRHGRARGLDFRLLHRHPVVTSARTKGGFVILFASYLVALVLLLPNTMLPKRLRIRGGRKLLGFWYPSRRS